MKKLFKHIKAIHHYSVGKQLLNDPFYKMGQERSHIEYLKTPNRSTIINYLLSFLNRETLYLEIGVRNPDDNFNKIEASKKYSVDPGVEYEKNPVDFKLTSDEFFKGLRDGDLLSDTIKFDLIFIDGLHLAEQVDRDINNALDFIKDDGFIVLHDCNPPTEWHARESFNFYFSPAGGYWNGTTWKAFLKQRFNPAVQSCCIDTDSGVGLISKKWPIGNSINPVNPFFEFNRLDTNRQHQLNLISFDSIKRLLEQLKSQ
jgi:hypothetical protein